MIWIKVKGYGDTYKINDLGYVKNTSTGKVLTTNTTSTNLRRVGLYKDGKTQHHMLHKLVYTNFIKEIPANHYVFHVDGDLSNNRLSNLNLREGKKEREKHPVRRYPEEIKQQVLQDLDDGVKDQKILDMYSMSVSYLYKIKKGYWDKHRIGYVKR